MSKTGTIIEQILNPYKEHNAKINKRINRWTRGIDKLTRIIGIATSFFITYTLLDVTLSTPKEKWKSNFYITNAIDNHEYTKAHIAIDKREKISPKLKTTDLAYILTLALNETITTKKAIDYFNHEHNKKNSKEQNINADIKKINTKDTNYTTSLEQIIDDNNTPRIVLGHDDGKICFYSLDQSAICAYIDNKIQGTIFPIPYNYSNNNNSAIIVGSQRGIIYRIHLQNRKPIIEVIRDEDGEISELQKITSKGEEMFIYQDTFQQTIAINQNGDNRFTKGEIHRDYTSPLLPITIAYQNNEPIIIAPKYNSLTLYDIRGNLLKKIETKDYTIQSEVIVTDQNNNGKQKLIFGVEETHRFISPFRLATLSLEKILTDPKLTTLSSQEVQPFYQIKYPLQRLSIININKDNLPDIILTNNSTTQIMYGSTEGNFKAAKLLTEDATITSPPIYIETTNANKINPIPERIIIPSNDDMLTIFNPSENNTTSNNNNNNNGSKNSDSSTNIPEMLYQIELTDSPGYNRLKYFSFTNQDNPNNSKGYIILANKKGLYAISEDWFL